MGKRLGVVLLSVAVLAGLAIAARKGKRHSDVKLDVGAAATKPAGEKRDAPTPGLPAQGRELGMPAIAKAAQAKKYLFAFFWREEDEQTTAMRAVFAAAMAKVGDRADSVVINVTESRAKQIVDKFDLDRAPMPLVLALAPNGAITGGFPKKFDEKNLLDAFATPCCERTMKALQSNKLVLVCVRNESTKSADAAMRGVRAFTADPQYAEVTEIVMLNPADAAEVSFLGDLKISPKTGEAVTALLAPPGTVIAEFTGQTRKEDLVAALQKASSGCCPGGSCGPNGCAPKNQP